jgi:hypothetical protein
MPDAELRESSNLRFKTGSIAPRVPLHGTRMGLGPPFRILIFGGDNSMSWIRAVALALPLVAASISTAEAADLPPGFYPGGAEPVILDRDAYKAFVARNQDKLQRIVQFITIIRANPQMKGCAGADKFVCIASLAQTFPIGSRFVADPKYRSQNAPLDDADVDINGKPIKANIMLTILHGQMGVDPLMAVMLDQNDDGKVTRVDVSLAGNPLSAKTFDDYEQTHVYEVALAIMPGTCDLTDRRKFYQFIENTLKPTLTGSHSVDASALAITDNNSMEVSGTLCGLPVSIRSMGTVSTDDVTLENPHGVSVSHWFTVGPIAVTPGAGTSSPTASPAQAGSGLHLGLGFLNLPPEMASAIHRPGLTGAWVLRVDPGSVAEKAGLKLGDIVTEYDGKPIHAAADLQAAVHPTPGAMVMLKVVRQSGDKGDDLEMHAQF